MTVTRRRPTLVAIVVLLLAASAAAADDWSYEPLSAEQVGSLRDAIAEMKANPRGPYLRIRWFCEDGAVLPPGPAACRDHGGGHQHAELRPEIARFGDWGFHFGTILQALDYDQFADLPNSGYRLRELVVQDFLVAADDGWVLRRARAYRGALQAEDEEVRGRELLAQRLADRSWRQANPLLATLLTDAVPHGESGVPGARMRTLAQEIAEADPGFESLRVRLHSTPGPDDLPAVREYLRAHGARLQQETRDRLTSLVRTMEAAYEVAPDAPRWEDLARGLQVAPLAESVRSIPDRLAQASPRERIHELSQLLRSSRDFLNRDLGTNGGRTAVAILDTVRYTRAVLFAEAGVWLSSSPTASRGALLEVAGDLIDAAYGTGWLVAREHEALRGTLARLRQPSSGREPSRAAYTQAVRYLAGAADWGAAALGQAFGPVIERYAPVEPLALEFRDDTIRGSVLLPFSTLMGHLVADASRALGMTHALFDREIGSGIVALNAGMAVGPLRLLDAGDDPGALDPEGIYVLPETPADLSPVAGILTLDQGSRLSHVQLLARGLGIPNASLDSSLLPLIRQHAGERVVYAVSALGSVVLTVDGARSAPAPAESPGPATTLTIDTDRLDLTTRRILPLESVDVGDSGRIVGPKAANLGRLHSLFPGRVAPGLVIPFGVFRQHVDRDLDGDGRTLYEEIADTFERRRAELARGDDQEVVEETVLRRLDGIRRQIAAMPLLPGFRDELRRSLAQRFGEPGTYGVFVRSDTNVEDLPNFSGAGLNLTVMNVIGTEAIEQAIRDVWASPFSRRSYQWRQRLLTNPEAVYPSIVLLRSVPSEASGVLVTTDVTGLGEALGERASSKTWTVTLARGIGGVVEGEAAETVLLPARADSAREPLLVSSARAPWQKRLDSSRGGIVRVPSSEDETLLTGPRIRDLRDVVNEILARYPRPETTGGDQPWDIEFGFVGDHTYLFQIRPLITSRTVSPLEAVSRLDRRVLDSGDQPVDLSAPVTVTRPG